MRKFTRGDQKKFFVNYWREKFPNKNLDELKKLASELAGRFAIPLHTQIAAEYFCSDILDKKGWLKNNFFDNELYREFILKIYIFYKSTKAGTNLTGYLAEIEHEKKIKEYDDIHQQLALAYLFPKIIPKPKLTENEATIINAIGIATISEDNNLISFDHKTFAEYFVAQFCFMKLTDETSEIENWILDLLLNKIIYSYDYNVIYNFLEDFLDKISLPQKILEKLSSRIMYYLDDNSLENNRFIEQSSEERLSVFLNQAIELISLVSLKALHQRHLDKLIENSLDDIMYTLVNSLRKIVRIFSIIFLRIFTKFLQEKLKLSTIELKQFSDGFKNGYYNINGISNIASFEINYNDYALGYTKQKNSTNADYNLAFLFIFERDFFIDPFNKMHRFFKDIRMSTNFNKSFLELQKNINISREEYIHIFIFNTLVMSQHSDRLNKIQKYFEYAISNNLLLLIDVVLNHLEEYEHKIEDVHNVILNVMKNSRSSMLIKILKFYSNIFRSENEVFMRHLSPPLNMITFDELEILLNNVEESSPDMIKYILTIGKVGMLIRVAYKHGFNDSFELQQKTINNHIIPILHYNEKQFTKFVKSNDRSFSFNNIKNILGTTYLFKIISLLIPEPYSNYFCDNPAIVEFCHNYLKDISDRTDYSSG